jgi:hypothetical protein
MIMMPAVAAMPLMIFGMAMAVIMIVRRDRPFLTAGTHR